MKGIQRTDSDYTREAGVRESWNAKIGNVAARSRREVVEVAQS